MNTLANFIKDNLNNSNLFETFDYNERNVIIDTIYNKNHPNTDEEAQTFLTKFNNLIKRNVLNNVNLVKKRQNIRRAFQLPANGDVFIDERGNKFRLVEAYTGKYQFCEEGSFCMFESGSASMSGGFAFNVLHKGKEIGSIVKEDLVNTGKKERRYFWFFMDNRSGGNRGLYFQAEVNIFKGK